MIKQLLVEIQPGIDLGSLGVIADTIGAYWLQNHSGRLSVTGIDPAISVDYWQVSGSTLTPNNTGSSSENWENIGGRLAPKE